MPAGSVCDDCGYDLRQTPRDGRCPECGSPARVSLGPKLLPPTTTQRRQLRQAAFWLALSHAAGLGFLVIGPLLNFVPFWDGDKSLPFPLRFSAMMCPIVVGAGMLGVRRLLDTLGDLADPAPQLPTRGEVSGGLCGLGLAGFWGSMMLLARSEARGEIEAIATCAMLSLAPLLAAGPWLYEVARLTRAARETLATTREAGGETHGRVGLHDRRLYALPALVVLPTALLFWEMFDLWRDVPYGVATFFRWTIWPAVYGALVISLLGSLAGALRLRRSAGRGSASL